MTTKTKTRFDVSNALETVRVLFQWTEARRQFTCFDVSRELRVRGQGVAHQATRDFVHSLHGLGLPPFAGSDYERVTQSFTTDSGHYDTAEVYRSKGDKTPYNPDQVTIGAKRKQTVASVVAKVDSDNQVKPSVIKRAASPAPAKPAVKKQKTVSVCSFCHKESCQSTPRTNITVDDDSADNAVKTSPKKDLGRFKVDARGCICIRSSLVYSMGLKHGDRVYLQRTSNGDINVMGAIPTTNYIGSLKVDKYCNIRVTRHLQGKAGITADEWSMRFDNGQVVLKA